MRYLALTKDDRDEILKELSIDDVNSLYPQDLLCKKEINLPNHKGEIEIENFLTDLSKKNLSANNRLFFLGGGCYNHHIPAAVDHIIQRAEFLTSYTPYQPEISQGTLITIFEFQSIISALTGMEVSNASMYDGATALAESILMSVRINKRNSISIYNTLNPDYFEVVKTYTKISDLKIETNKKKIDKNTSCVIVQYPDFYGNISKFNDIRAECDEVGALLIVCITEIVSLGLLPPPSIADIVVGEASSIGVGMNFGGPHLGFFACKKRNLRQMPGRICGFTFDKDKKPGYVLTLNAREQHIRRGKATSNICSNQGLCATAFVIHSFLLGEIGFKKLALINHHRAVLLYNKLKQVKNIKVLNDSFFNEFMIELPLDSGFVNKKLIEQNIIGGLDIGNNRMLIAVTELTMEKDIDVFVNTIERIIS